MNFLTRLFKPSPPLPSAEHPIFGRMQAVIDYGDGTYFWEGGKPVETSLGYLETSFDSPAGGPSEADTRRWLDLVANYSAHFANLEPLLRENLADFGEESEFDSLKLVSIALHDRPDVEFEWEFVYEIRDRRIYTVLFAEGRPKVVTVDA